MTIDELKGLESKHGSGWRFQDNTEDKSVSGEVQFLNAFLGLRKELLALWEAANKFGKKEWAFMGRHGYMAGPDFHDALERLNKKASTMDA